MRIESEIGENTKKMWERKEKGIGHGHKKMSDR